jgi:hypothetical protein
MNERKNGFGMFIAVLESCKAAVVEISALKSGSIPTTTSVALARIYCVNRNRANKNHLEDKATRNFPIGFDLTKPTEIEVFCPEVMKTDLLKDTSVMRESFKTAFSLQLSFSIIFQSLKSPFGVAIGVTFIPLSNTKQKTKCASAKRNLERKEENKKSL